MREVVSMINATETLIEYEIHDILSKIIDFTLKNF